MAPPVDDTRRYDLYLCAESSGPIAVASSASSRLSSIDAGDLANAVFDSIVKSAHDSGRIPSVFYAARCVRGRHDESVDAAMQTRGGGVSLFMITKPFLGDEACIAKLLCFLFMQESAPDGAEVDFRFALVGISEKEFLRHPSIQPHAHLLAEYKLHSIAVGAIAEVTSRIAELVWTSWLYPSSPNVLGATVKESLLDLMRRVFREYEVSLAKLVFGIEDREVTTLAAVFNMALSTYTISSGYDGSTLLSKLATVGSGLTSAERIAAIEAYQRKWSGARVWDWSSDARDALKSISAPPLAAPGPTVIPDQDAAQPPGFMQRSPSGVLFDYDNPATEEGRLKRGLLRSDSAHDFVAAVAANGMGGVGKTCALRGLGRLRDVWRRFRGRIFFLIMRACRNDEYARENPDEDAAQPPGFVQRNPSGVLLDYDNPATEEGRLKRALLRTDSAHDFVAAVAAHGMGGVGKTCALRGLGRLRDVWRRFPGGIFFLELGQDASVSDVLRMLSKIMRARGNDEHAREISTCSTVKAAVDIVLTPLSSVSCLFLIDDVWSTASCIAGHLEDLQHLVESNEQSRMVFSTRDKTIADYVSARTVSFGTRDEATSRRMLLNYSGFTEEEANSMPADAVESLQSSLSVCGGLPIALAATGRLVESESKRLGEGMSKCEAWSVHKKNSAPYYALCAHAQHRGLSAALMQCVTEVGKRLCSDGQEYKHSAAEMYRALCVLEKQSWVPFSMLCALWSIDAVSGIVKRVAEAFEALSMLEIEVREVGTSSVHGIKLHDLAHDFCTRQAIESGENKGTWHAALLSGYLRHDTVTCGLTRPWWSVPNDGYIYVHVIRHLLACHEIAEATGLLLDFRYILAQVEHNELDFLTQDIDRVAAYLREASGERSSEASGSNLAALELLGRTIRLSWSGIARDARALPHRLAFQLLGRMNQCKTENADVDRLLRSVGEYGPAPFLRPLSLTLSMPRPDLRISLDMGRGYVYAVAWIPRSSRVVVVTEDSRVLFVVDISTGQTVHTLNGHVFLQAGLGGKGTNGVPLLSASP